MNEEELNEIIKLKNDYEMASFYTKQWQDFIFDRQRPRSSDDYYSIKIKDTYTTEKELTIHLPTIVMAMERYSQGLYEKYQKKLKEKTNVL